ncbi:hypothetical protein ACWGQ5_13130 [Streptomyces sp. NPDC055722]
MSKSITLDQWLENGMTPEDIVRIICKNPQLSAVVGDSIAYSAAEARHEKEPSGAADWERKATRYLLEKSIRDYARSVGEEHQRRLSARARAVAAHRAATGK